MSTQNRPKPKGQRTSARRVRGPVPHASTFRGTPTDPTPDRPRFRRIRFVLVGVFLIAVALVVTVEVVRLWAFPGLVTDQAAQRLTAAYGTEVEVGGAEVGYFTSSLHGVRLRESGPDAPPEPWMTLDRVEADVPLWDLLGGHVSPRGLTFRSPAVTLRFDQEGRLLTRCRHEKGNPRLCRTSTSRRGD